MCLWVCVSVCWVLPIQVFWSHLICNPPRFAPSFAVKFSLLPSPSERPVHQSNYSILCPMYIHHTVPYTYCLCFLRTMPFLSPLEILFISHLIFNFDIHVLIGRIYKCNWILSFFKVSFDLVEAWWFFGGVFGIFFKGHYIICKYKHFLSFFLICMPFISFSCLLHQVQLLALYWIRMVRAISLSVPDLRGKAVSPI